MIDATLGLIAAQLNQHLQGSGSAAADRVVLAELPWGHGEAAAEPTDQVSLFLAGVERDETGQRGPEPLATSGLSRVLGHASLRLDLLVLCAANFRPEAYLEALASLSRVVLFLQSKPMMDHHNTPEMDPRLERLTLAIENMNTQELNGLWRIHGGRYVPSVLYRVRVLGLGVPRISHQAPLIHASEAEVRP